MNIVDLARPEIRVRLAREGQARFDRPAGEAWATRANVTVFFFEAFDEPWKGDPGNPLGAEKHWGLFFVDRSPKQFLRERASSATPAPAD